MSLKIIRPVTVKVIVTEELKERVASDLQQAIHRIDGELQQLDFQAKRTLSDLEKTTPQRVAVVKSQFEVERQKRLDTRRELVEKLKAIAGLPLGQETVHSTVESLVEVRVGDVWKSSVEIVLKDDRIVEIR